MPTLAHVQGWTVRINKEGVRVYKRTDNGGDSIHMIRAATEMRGDPADFVGAGLMDTTAKFRAMFPRFDPMVVDCEVRCDTV